jgi:hypothetical protein
MNSVKRLFYVILLSSSTRIILRKNHCHTNGQGDRRLFTEDSLEGQQLVIHGVMSEEDIVWVQLYIGNAKIGDVFPVRVGTKENIYDLKTAVYQVAAKSLRHCDAFQLDVYMAGTKLPPKEEVPLDPGEVVPTGTTSKNPLRVVAPDTSNQHGT